MKKIIALLLLIPLPILAQTSFEEIFDINPGKLETIANRVTQHHAEDVDMGFTQEKQLLQSTSNELNLLLSQQPNNPVLWFLLGLNYNNLASLHFALDPANTQKYISKKLDAYEQAMKTDNTQKPVLSASIYATMKHALPMDKKIIAIQKELALGGNGENESYYWYLHWSNIHNLTQADRLEEARKAAQQLQKELQASGHSNNDYQTIVKKARAGIDQAQMLKNKKTGPTTSKKERKQEPSKPDPYQELVSMNRILWTVVIVLVVLLLVGLFFEKRSRKK